MIPDDALVYVPGHGETTAGAIRASREPSLDDENEATYQMWEDIATRNLLRKPWEPVVSTSDIKAFHAARFHSRYGAPPR